VVLANLDRPAAERIGLAAQVSHPHLAQVFEVGEDGDAYYAAMEHVAGESLAEIILQAKQIKKTIEPEIALRIVADAAAGVDALHDANLVHGAIDPDRLFVTRKGVVKILGFGPALDRDSDLRALGAILKELLEGAKLSPSTEILVTRTFNSAKEMRDSIDDHLYASGKRVLARHLGEWIDRLFPPEPPSETAPDSTAETVLDTDHEEDARPTVHMVAPDPSAREEFLESIARERRESASVNPMPIAEPSIKRFPTPSVPPPKLKIPWEAITTGVVIVSVAFFLLAVYLRFG
jgi:serine/threonine protein kinase